MIKEHENSIITREINEMAIDLISHDIGVYGILHKNKIIYIGSSNNLKHRLKQHLVYRNSNNNFPKQNIMFEILWYNDNEDYLEEQEIELINIHRPKMNERDNLSILIPRFFATYNNIMKLKDRLELDDIKLIEKFQKQYGISLFN